MTPSVVFIGRAKHSWAEPHFSEISNAPLAPQMALSPAMQAIPPGVQADFSVREANRALKDLALARLAAATSGETVAVAAGTEVLTVGTWLFGVPVTSTVAEGGVVRKKGAVVVTADGVSVGVCVATVVVGADVGGDAAGCSVSVVVGVAVVSPGTGNANDSDDCSGTVWEEASPSPGAGAAVVGSGAKDDSLRAAEVACGGSEMVLNMGGRVAAASVVVVRGLVAREDSTGADGL